MVGRESTTQINLYPKKNSSSKTALVNLGKEQPGFF